MKGKECLIAPRFLILKFGGLNIDEVKNGLRTRSQERVSEVNERRYKKRAKSVW